MCSLFFPIIQILFTIEKKNVYFISSALCILLIHLLLKTKFHYLPESVAVVFLGKSKILLNLVLWKYFMG